MDRDVLLVLELVGVLTKSITIILYRISDNVIPVAGAVQYNRTFHGNEISQKERVYFPALLCSSSCPTLNWGWHKPASQFPTNHGLSDKQALTAPKFYGVGVFKMDALVAGVSAVQTCCIKSIHLVLWSHRG